MSNEFMLRVALLELEDAANTCLGAGAPREVWELAFHACDVLQEYIDEEADASN